ncbi:glutamate synthase large subunit [bacterium]|nr:glutamate synthase large subunit [bacterium]
MPHNLGQSDLFDIPLYHRNVEKLAEHGIHDPDFEKDACGIGMVAAIDGQPRREVVQKAIQALKSVWHRGAEAADGKTGDGAGIHLSIPKSFFADYLASIGRESVQRALGVGMVFLPRKDMHALEACRSILEQEVIRMGHGIYGWRHVPVNPSVIGDIANDSRPEIEQIMVSDLKGLDEAAFERDLYLIRKRASKAAREAGIKEFYIVSLSCRSIVYKGLFKAEQLTEFYPDLADERFVSNFAIFHQRFSTNSAPAWALAQPFRVLAHNGEINTLRGNIQWMKSHEANMHSPIFEGHIEDLKPVIEPGLLSDTAALDMAMELLVKGGRSLPYAKHIVMPPAWGYDTHLDEELRAFYSHCNSTMEPWDGPAAIAGYDGEWVIAGMDRNGLRPLRYTLTKDGLLLVGSETGMVPVEEIDIIRKGRIGPGQMIGVHLPKGRFYQDAEIKHELAGSQPFKEWTAGCKSLHSLVQPSKHQPISGETLLRRQYAAGMTHEYLELILDPMAVTGKEGVGSMGDDTPLAVLSSGYRGLHHFFRQNFSQVTNPPIDSLRERYVMTLTTRFGNTGNILDLQRPHSPHLLLKSPLLLDAQYQALMHYLGHHAVLLDATYPVNDDADALKLALRALQHQAEKALGEGRMAFILSDSKAGPERMAIPMVLAVGALQSLFVRLHKRKQVSIVAHTAECTDVHAFAVMVGVGATAVAPYLLEDTVRERHARGLYGKLSETEALANFTKSMEDGLLKIMAKMGISVVSSYRGGCNFEILGLARSLVAEYFPGLQSRMSGIGLRGIHKKILALQEEAYDPARMILPVGGFYRQRAGQEVHGYEASLVHLLQSAVEKGAYQLYRKYADGVNAQAPIHPRSLLGFVSGRTPVPLEQVESITDIRKRFVTPAMSLGALSPEAHEILTIAMNRIGASSNSGEGGEDPGRYEVQANGDNLNSTIKQVASGRFGVTAEYLNACREIQIKVAQGAKPGEGGQLPGFKVTEMIARLRHATPGVMLISPPPHHDIYSIEDLAQLIYDLKQINPTAIVSVKLVSQAGIGTIACGVAKAKADKILVSGHSGGTGASPHSSIKYTGSPWELGLAETNQMLTMNQLRHRVVLQTDGGLKTGQDIVIAAMLGAEEFGIGTASLVAMGCLLVRQCHSNTCPVGICTQDPALRAKFEGTVDKVINLMSFIAQDIREILASLGFTKLEDVIGRSDLLTQLNRGGRDLVDLDLNPMLIGADPGPHARYCTLGGRNEVPASLDNRMLEHAKTALESGQKIQLDYLVNNTYRSIGARLSSYIVRHYKGRALQDGHIHLGLRGSAGQSLGAFLVKGIKIALRGDANDYVGKGLSGGVIAVQPTPSSPLVPQDNTIIGNTVLYGATSGKLFASGQAGERFAVRNSGATAVVEGCGAHGCEYMTGGLVAVLGEVGDNFAAGMTGGMAFVYDPENRLSMRINAETVVHQPVASSHWEGVLKALLQEHQRETGSIMAGRILHDWDEHLPYFMQVCPKEMLTRLDQPLTEERPGKKKAS